MQIAILAGGVGGSRFVRGVRHGYPDAELTVVVNTADDIMLHGLHISPDLDTMMYSLGGGIDAERGWGRSEETWRTSAELAAYGVEPSWFGLGDLDLATHLVRTQMLDAGYPLSAVTQALCTRWLHDSDHLRLLPMTDDRVETHIVIDDPATSAESGGPPSDAAERRQRAVHFQEYWVKLHAEPEARQVLLVGIDTARPAPGVIEAINAADLVLIAPSNPVVSIGPVLAVPGIGAAVRGTRAPVIGFSGIIGGAPVLGMAHRLLPAIGVQTDAESVGRHYGSRRDGGVLDAWIVDNADAAAVPRLTEAGLAAGSTDLIMSEPAATAEFIQHGVKLACE
ncbi:2-phospho-L-lactate transferase [Microlunatus soli]|uniref:LPPG:FO 2-phospho-L-lactate transferase n=1 Tax=Microlunatus soli TaxID=630515 RepID=A0A1H1XGP9_9ACTN|nr:2-phospho-L-lactate transferase [Microlunatus soli]SDT08437.1 LPPG:FO 2-phospho-L-lactate transferase [Microlunatus soli]